MAGRYPYSQQPGSSRPPPPPPPLPPLGNASATEIYDYNYGFRYPSSISRLAPGQAPSREPAVQPLLKEAVVVLPAEALGTKEFYCEPCDLELDSAQALKSHCRTHLKCTECSFEGAPKIVKAHYQGVHGKFSGSGFKAVTIAIPGCRVQRFRICVGNRPEDIQRWIEERKKRFPRQQKKENSDNTTKSTGGEANASAHLGMSSLLAGYGSSGSESEDDNDGTESRVQAAAEVEGHVSTPGAHVKHDEDTPGAKTTTTPTPSPPSNTSADVKRIGRPCQFFSKNGSCLKGDACRFSHDAAVNRPTSKPFDRDRKRKRGGHATSDTLLRKLLASDMERESVLTMQLLEYIVEKKFFGCDG